MKSCECNDRCHSGSGTSKLRCDSVCGKFGTVRVTFLAWLTLRLVEPGVDPHDEVRKIQTGPLYLHALMSPIWMGDHRKGLALFLSAVSTGNWVLKRWVQSTPTSVPRILSGFLSQGAS